MALRLSSSLSFMKRLKGDFVCPSGTALVCTAFVLNLLWLTCVLKGSGFLPFRNVRNLRLSSPCPRRRVPCRFSCVVSCVIAFLCGSVPRRRVSYSFPCVVSCFPPAVSSPVRDAEFCAVFPASCLGRVFCCVVPCRDAEFLAVFPALCPLLINA